MIIQDNFTLNYDLSGNLVLTIPKSYLRNTEQERLLETVEKVLKSESEKIRSVASWEEDPALDIVGMGQSNMNDGSIIHDEHLYGGE